MMTLVKNWRFGVMIAVITLYSSASAAQSQTRALFSDTISIRQTGGIKSSIELPGSRLQGRLDTRIASRLNNRLDRTFDPDATETTSFEKAQDRVEGQTRAR